MAKTKKTTFKVFDYMHCDDFAKYLERMAAKGWHFKEWGAGFKFEKGEPKQVTYAVEVFTKASENDLRPEAKTQEFAQYCEAAGWKLIDAKQKFCIFRKIDENAVDILTPEERVENSFKGIVSGSNIILLILYGLNAALQFRNMFGSMFSYSIFSTISFFNISAWTFLFLTQLIKITYAVISKRKLWKRIKNGQEIYIGSNKDGKKRWNGHFFSTMFLCMLFLFMLVMLEDNTLMIYYVVIFAGTFIFCLILAKVRPDADTNMAIQVVFVIVYCFIVILIPIIILSGRQEDKKKLENVPLQISDYRQDFGVLEGVSDSYERNMLGSRESYFLYGTGENIHYQIYRSKCDWILNRIWEEEIDEKYNENKTDCKEAWEAEIAFRNEGGDYYVRYEDAVLIFCDNENIYLDSNQISIIRDKLQLR